ncbi:hypothetical protein [Spirosoma utsteinense]|uniref:hypothetical protein n=1 Tax=Spirosoma utsteinense TaxID=2585773 RepID=UPI001646B4B4|nr:hypothetical protein [Spirosoma utsteinense]MBC3785713.1 hypothetical protein [Spirosoma utsteinense]
MTLLLASLLMSVLSGLAATTYVNILTQPDQVLAFWARFLYRLQTLYMTHGDPSEERPVMAFKEKRYKISEWLLKPLLTCVYCVAGQMGLWLSIYVFYAYFTTFNPILSILTAVVSVWMGGFFQSIQQRYFPL